MICSRVNPVNRPSRSRRNRSTRSCCSECGCPPARTAAASCSRRSAAAAASPGGKPCPTAPRCRRRQVAPHAPLAHPAAVAAAGRTRDRLPAPHATTGVPTARWSTGAPAATTEHRSRRSAPQSDPRDGRRTAVPSADRCARLSSAAHTCGSRPRSAAAYRYSVSARWAVKASAALISLQHHSADSSARQPSSVRVRRLGVVSAGSRRPTSTRGGHITGMRMRKLPPAGLQHPDHLLIGHRGQLDPVQQRSQLGTRGRRPQVRGEVLLLGHDRTYGRSPTVLGGGRADSQKTLSSSRTSDCPAPVQTHAPSALTPRTHNTVASTVRSDIISTVAHREQMKPFAGLRIVGQAQHVDHDLVEIAGARSVDHGRLRLVAVRAARRDHGRSQLGHRGGPDLPAQIGGHVDRPAPVGPRTGRSPSRSARPPAPRPTRSRRRDCGCGRSPESRRPAGPVRRAPSNSVPGPLRRLSVSAAATPTTASSAPWYG